MVKVMFAMSDVEGVEGRGWCKAPRWTKKDLQVRIGLIMTKRQERIKWNSVPRFLLLRSISTQAN